MLPSCCSSTWTVWWCCWSSQSDEHLDDDGALNMISPAEYTRDMKLSWPIYTLCIHLSVPKVALVFSACVCVLLFAIAYIIIIFKFSWVCFIHSSSLVIKWLQLMITCSAFFLCIATVNSLIILHTSDRNMMGQKSSFLPLLLTTIQAKLQVLVQRDNFQGGPLGVHVQTGSSRVGEGQSKCTLFIQLTRNQVMQVEHKTFTHDIWWNIFKFNELLSAQSIQTMHNTHGSYWFRSVFHFSPCQFPTCIHLQNKYTWCYYLWPKGTHGVAVLDQKKCKRCWSTWNLFRQTSTKYTMYLTKKNYRYNASIKISLCAKFQTQGVPCFSEIFKFIRETCDVHCLEVWAQLVPVVVVVI